MKIVGVMLWRDENWCSGWTIERAMLWCDELVIVKDALSVTSPKKLSIVSASIHVIEHRQREIDGADFREGDMREVGLLEARRLGATHIGVIDADEAVQALSSDVRGYVSALGPREALCAPQLAAWKGLSMVRVDGHFLNPFWSFAFRDGPGVTYLNDDNYQIHRRLPLGDWKQLVMPHAGLIHLQFASPLRVAAKAVWYKLIENTRYRGRLSIEQINRQYDWWADDSDARLVRCSRLPRPDRIDLLSPPWQLEAAREIVRKNPGCERGINLHGIDLSSE